MVFSRFKFGDEFFVGLEYKYIVFFVVYNNDVFIFIYSYFFGFQQFIGIYFIYVFFFRGENIDLFIVIVSNQVVIIEGGGYFRGSLYFIRNSIWRFKFQFVIFIRVEYLYSLIVIVGYNDFVIYYVQILGIGEFVFVSFFFFYFYYQIVFYGIVFFV